MGFTHGEVSFFPVLPAMRSRSAILRDVGKRLSGRAGDASRAALAEIELHAHDGDRAERAGQHQTALAKYLRAHASIYKLLNPDFDVSAYVSEPAAPPLPATDGVRQDLLDISGRLAAAIRPAGSARTRPVVAAPANRGAAANALTAGLTRFTQIGFHEPVPVEETLQGATQRAAALIADGQADTAAVLLQQAIEAAGSASEFSESPEPVQLAAAFLNLSTARLVLGDTKGSAASAKEALQGFRTAGDRVGQAQALHAGGVAAARAGDQSGAEELFEQAADVLEQDCAPAPPPAPVPPAPTAQSSVVAVSLQTPGPEVAEALDAPGLEPAGLGRDLAALTAVIGNQRALTVRSTGREDGWAVLPLPDETQTKGGAKAWQVGVRSGEGVALFPVGSGLAPAPAAMIQQVYEPRAVASKIGAMHWSLADDPGGWIWLIYLFCYILPLKMGDSLSQQGLFEPAEGWYLTAAAYPYINLDVEATAVWTRLARNAIAWGNARYKSEDFAGATAQYAKIVTPEGGVPAASPLYRTANLARPAASASAVVAHLDRPPPADVNPEIAAAVLEPWSFLQQIAGGLDFYGLLLSPIHTFEYLQSVARAFAQEATQAEQESMTFSVRQETAASQRRDLQSAVASAQAEATARRRQHEEAGADLQAANDALNLARRRLADAQKQRTDYANLGDSQIWGQAAAAALGGGQDALYSEISDLADRLARGETISGPGPKLAAAEILYSGRRNREYELTKMDATIAELTDAVTIAQDQVTAADRRQGATLAAWTAAEQKALLAASALDAYDRQLFQPDSWKKMAQIVEDIAQSYLFRAIRVAKLMERAYNFENDTALHIIKADYGYPVTSSGPLLLGGESLLADIDAFTYNAISGKTRKSSRIKDVISLSADYPAHFEQFRTSGVLSFETDLYEFDRRHPGFYGQRIEAVEVAIVGLLPPGGLNGTLSAGGVTSFRTVDGSAAKRTHVVDTMALSDFQTRDDAFFYTADTGVRGLFQGLGLGGTWQLRLPRRGNDFDFRRVLDVQLLLYYTATYDAGLKAATLARPPRPGELARQRSFGLRYDFPDSWYAFYRDGVAAYTLDRLRLPLNQENFTATMAAFRVVTKEGVANAGIQVRVTGPTGASGTATTDANGVVSSELPALAGLAAGDPVGDWRIEVLGGPPLMDEGRVRYDRVYNIQMGLNYTFTYVPEAE